MSSKVIDVRAGDRWTKDSGDNQHRMWLYRDGKCRCYTPSHECNSIATREPHETDLPTPEAHAQLREWGYEVRGEDVAKTLEVNVALITESRVREIVREELAKAKPAPAPEPDWRGLLDAVVNAPSFTAHGMAIKKAAEALSSARTKLAAKGGK
ncbi:MAG: hypothetical protein KGR25_00010 [Chloroflexi bacterium]|nr:hypothetical protein [Chloroflexota bacterium]